MIKNWVSPGPKWLPLRTLSQVVKRWGCQLIGRAPMYPQGKSKTCTGCKLENQTRLTPLIFPSDMKNLYPKDLYANWYLSQAAANLMLHFRTSADDS